jgi:hypothetical protein
MIPYYLKKNILSQLFVVEITSIDIAKKKATTGSIQKEIF